MNSIELRSMLTGIILGDGYIDNGVTKRALHIKSIYPEFTEYIKSTLDHSTNFITIIKKYDGGFRGGCNHKDYSQLTVRSHPYFNKKYSHFYDDYKHRRITTQSLKWLTPIGLAMWFASDGYIVLVGKTKGKIVDRRVEIATDRYKESDVDKIIEYFETTYNYKMKKVKRKEGVFRIRFSLSDAQHFLIMISPYIVPSMSFKLNMRYDYRPEWMCDQYFNIMKNLSSTYPLPSNVEGEDIVYS